MLILTISRVFIVASLLILSNFLRFVKILFFKKLSTLNVNKSSGLDGLPVRFLIDAVKVIERLITHIVNVSIRSEMVLI